MPLIPKFNQAPRILAPAGTHIARVIGLIYLGTITEDYMGSPLTNQKIRLTFELVDELHTFKEGEEAKPLVVSQEYTLSMGKKSNLRPIVEGIIGTSLTDEEAYAFDVEKLLNLPCLVSIKIGKSQKGSEYTKVAGTSILMKGQVAKDSFNPITKLTYDSWNEDVFQKLPQFIREKMTSSEEYKVMKGTKTEIDVDDLAF